MLNDLKNWFGERCSGVKVNGEVMDCINIPSKHLRFCEAVNYSFDVPIHLNNDNLNCPGARETFGFDHQSNDLAARISKNTGIPETYIIDSLSQVPVMNKTVHTLILGITEDMEKFLLPDVYIVYTKPEKLMQFIHQVARFEQKPFISPFSLLSICGNVFTRSYRDRAISVSFGCPESRNAGGIREDEVVVGIPYKLVKKLKDSDALAYDTGKLDEVHEEV